MKFENTQVMNFEAALRGMRNPKESWHLSDSAFGIATEEDCEKDWEIAEHWVKDSFDINTREYDIELEKIDMWLIRNGVLRNENGCIEYAFIGPKDMKLAKGLIKGGSEHRKFMRQIFVSVDITAPLYWWKEFDTYKVGTVANSTSTMHKMASKPITRELFETDDAVDFNAFVPGFIGEEGLSADDCESLIIRFIDFLEGLRLAYLETKDERYWKELIRWLPESWLQTRTVTMNYENLLAMCSKGQRRFHKLNEWSGIHTSVADSFIQWARTLPYAADLIFIDESKKEA